MACNRNQTCLSLANKYPPLQGEIASAISSIQSKVEEIIGALDGVSIPNDYLGAKVKSSINSISSSLNSDISKLATAGKQINSFAESKMKEHKKHYEAWKFEQQWRMQKKREAEAEKRQVE